VATQVSGRDTKSLVVGGEFLDSRFLKAGKMIEFNLPFITESDRAFLDDALTRGKSSGVGYFTSASEEMITNRLLTKKTLLTTSCTHALEISALLASLQPGDEVIMPSYTFVSTASAFALFGARPVFVDSRSDTLNIDATKIEAAISSKTRAICVVHYGGVACEMEQILQIAAKHNLLLIEDNAHGLFAKYKGKYLGTFGALATQSFHETKNIICGEGGALIVNDEALVERAEILREKGTNRSRFLRGQVDKYTWVDIGSSWVMSDLLAAILYGQLLRADEINTRRLQIWDRYHTELSGWAQQHDVTTPYVPEGCEHVGHVYHLRFGNLAQRTRFITVLKDQQISAVFHYQALHMSPVGQHFGGYVGQCPVAEHASDCLVRLPLFNSMTDDQQSRVIDAVQQFVP
jgi:dTDP-4-amino-4,6-dideoxygalactose transaminase